MNDLLLSHYAVMAARSLEPVNRSMLLVVRRVGTATGALVTLTSALADWRRRQRRLQQFQPLTPHQLRDLGLDHVDQWGAGLRGSQPPRRRD